MTLLGLQQEFAWHAGRLLLRAAEMGYAVTLGDAARSLEEQRRLIAAGLSHVKDPATGAHVRRLAVDLNLFHGGHWLKASEDHEALAAWWRDQHELARWGGVWSDGNHYSFEWRGVRGGRSLSDPRC